MCGSTDDLEVLDPSRDEESLLKPFSSSINEGQHYRSLTVIAERITGAHWSGPRFFGLTKRTGASVSAKAAE